ncbi:hypothetical protein Tcan_18450 [Toxocara canis]|uniref:Globin domain-containing protein n=1 Tax=Toxocara canis TaxID=6265 RepID=A0A0B2UXI9_TOXCA|nr:hypothetical protein Tcan_18450 [Toxocara canis]
MGQTESASCPADLNLSAKATKRLTRSSATQSAASKSDELLTAHQRILLQKSWNKSQKTGLENIGAHVFLKIYHREPSVKTLFGIEDVPHAELKYNKIFQNHAMTFTRSLDFILANLNKLDIVANFCRQLGRRHTQYITRGFRPEYWDAFAEALTECAIDWEGGLRCREALNGWRTLVGFLIEEMRIGFMKAKREQMSRRAMLRNTIVASEPSLASDNFVSSMPFVDAGSCGLRCREALNGWRTLVGFLIEEMRIGFMKAKREQMSRRAMLRNTIVASEPSLASDNFVSSMPFVDAGSCRSIRESSRHLSIKSLSTARPLVKPLCTKCSDCTKHAIQREAFSEGTNVVQEDYFDQLFLPKVSRFP